MIDAVPPESVRSTPRYTYRSVVPALPRIAAPPSVERTVRFPPIVPSILLFDPVTSEFPTVVTLTSPVTAR